MFSPLCTSICECIKKIQKWNTLFMSLFVLECWVHLCNKNDSGSVEPGYVKYRLKSVKPDFPNHRQHSQTEDEVECHSYGPDFSPPYHQKRTGGNDGTLSCRNMPVAGTHLVTCLRRSSPQTWAMHWLTIFWRIFPWPCAKWAEMHCRCRKGPTLTAHIEHEVHKHSHTCSCNNSTDRWLQTII